MASIDGRWFIELDYILIWFSWIVFSIVGIFYWGIIIILFDRVVGWAGLYFG